MSHQSVSSVDLRAFSWSQRLLNQYANDFPSVSSLFVGNSASREDWARTIERVRSSRTERPDIVSVLRDQLDRRFAPSEAKANAARLGSADAFAVVTGQQAGLFGGPAYTLHKAVSAIRIARWVETEFGVPAVPVFWVESEDHDWEEVRRAAFLDSGLVVRQAKAEDPPGARTHSVGQLRFADDDRALQDLIAALPTTEFTQDVLRGLRYRYGPGAAVGPAFAGWLDDQLGKFGLVVYEADDPRAKPFVADLFAEELSQPGRSARIVRRSAGVLRDGGFEPQLEPNDDAISLFYLDEQGRRLIRQVDGLLTLGDRAASAADAAKEAREHPERFSPNVILRPLVQDRLFPTICYVGGPSEFVYQSQLRDVYVTFGVEAPLLHPRLSVTVAEASTARFLGRHGLTIADLHSNADVLLKRLVERELPEGLEETFSDVQGLFVAQLERLRSAVTQVDATLGGALDTTVTRIRDAVTGLQNKVIQAAKRKDDTLRRQLERAQGLAYPGGEPQERALSGLALLNRYGPAIFDRLLELDPMAPGRHHVIYP